MNRFRPLLAYRKNPPLNAIKYPKFGSPKFDGIRANHQESQELKTRKLKLVPNILVRKRFDDERLTWTDGELIVGKPTDSGVYAATESVVMSYAPPKPVDKVSLYLFDHFRDPSAPYWERLEELHRIRLPKHVVVVKQTILRNADEVLEYEEEQVRLGYEGIMLRDQYGRYKYGRSTLREEILMKYVRFEDSEAIITGFEEQMENQNEAKLNELGYMKRSKKQEGMVGKGTMGAILGYDPKKKWEVRAGMGPGLTGELRAELWARRHELLKKKSWFKYRFKPAGTKDKPRSPRYMGLRSSKDM